MWFAFALAIFGAISDNLSAIQAYIDPKFYSFSLIIISMVVAILRLLTSEPIND
jgi:hypothetical protein